MGGGRWEVGSGKWEVGSGRWEVGGVRWEMRNEELGIGVQLVII